MSKFSNMRPCTLRGDRDRQRFWSKVARADEPACWLWLGTVQYGYGQFKVGGRTGYSLMAHRIAYW